MTVVVLSPPEERPREPAMVEALFAAGLDRYHLRKPGWDGRQISTWLEEVPARWRERVVLHSHHALAADFRLWGVHFSDRQSSTGGRPGDAAPGCRTSRSCHDVAAVKAALGRCDSLFFGPVFPSVSKPGYGPVPASMLEELRAVLATKSEAQRSTQVLALGGITPFRIERCLALGFDGVAIMGAIWAAADPVAAFLEFQSARRRQADRAAFTSEHLQ